VARATSTPIRISARGRKSWNFAATGRKIYDGSETGVPYLHGVVAISDTIPIILDEWLVEIGSMNYSFGRGIAEWSFVLIPGKAVVVLGIAALIATNLVLLRAAGKTCAVSARLGSLAATGAGAFVAGAAAITITWVVCCAAPTWVVGLSVMGVGVATALALAPLGGWLSLLGFSTLVASAILLLRQLSKRRSRDVTIPVMLMPIARAPS